MTKVTFTKYEREKCADGVIARYAGDVDGTQFVGDADSVSGLSVSPKRLQRTVSKAAKKGLCFYEKGIINPVTVVLD